MTTDADQRISWCSEQRGGTTAIGAAVRVADGWDTTTLANAPGCTQRVVMAPGQAGALRLISVGVAHAVAAGGRVDLAVHTSDGQVERSQRLDTASTGSAPRGFVNGDRWMAIWQRGRAAKAASGSPTGTAAVTTITRCAQDVSTSQAGRWVGIAWMCPGANSSPVFADVRRVT